jgi:hypothetical protein
MDLFLGQTGPAEVSAEQRTANEFICRIRKLRWIGMDDETEQLLVQLRSCCVQPTDSVIAEACDTD